MVEFFLGLYLLAAGVTGNAGGLLAAIMAEGAFIPFIVALSVIYWIWQNVPDKERGPVHSLIIVAGMSVAISQYKRIISSFQTGWSDIKNIGSGGGTIGGSADNGLLPGFSGGWSGSSTNPFASSISAAQSAYPALGANGISLAAIQAKETGGLPNAATAVSSTGATGLFQILPSTAASPGYGVAPISADQLTDPNANAMFAGSYLNGLLSAGYSPAAAINQYSGGNYQLSDLQTGY